MARMIKIKIRQSPKNKQFYTAILAPNGEPIFDGCEGHPRKSSADRMITKLVTAIKENKFQVVDELFEKTPAKSVAKKSATKPKVKVVVRGRKTTATMVPGPATAQ